MHVEYPDGETESLRGHDEQIFGPAKLKARAPSNRLCLIVRKAEHSGSKTLQFDDINLEYKYSDGTLASTNSSPVPDPNGVNMISYLGGATLLILHGSTPTQMDRGTICTPDLTAYMCGMLTCPITDG